MAQHGVLRVQCSLHDDLVRVCFSSPVSGWVKCVRLVSVRACFCQLFTSTLLSTLLSSFFFLVSRQMMPCALEKNLALFRKAVVPPI